MAEVIPIGSDHAGYQLKERLVEELRSLGYQPLDLGTHSSESTDYPDYAHEVASKVGLTMIGRAVGKHYLLFTGAHRLVKKGVSAHA